MIYVENFATKDDKTNVYVVGKIIKINKIDGEIKNSKLNGSGWCEIALQIVDEKCNNLNQIRKLIVNQNEIKNFKVNSLGIFKGQLDCGISNYGYLLPKGNNYFDYGENNEKCDMNSKFKSKNLQDYMWNKIDDFKYVGELENQNNIVENIYHKIGWDEKIKDEQLKNDLIEIVKKSQKYKTTLNRINNDFNKIGYYDENGDFDENYSFIEDKIGWVLQPMKEIENGLDGFINKLNEYVNIVPEINFVSNFVEESEIKEYKIKNNERER